jgi:hypothetical protein
VVLAGALLGIDGWGWDELGEAVGGEADGPALAVHHPVVELAEQRAVGR